MATVSYVGNNSHHLQVFPDPNGNLALYSSNNDVNTISASQTTRPLPDFSSSSYTSYSGNSNYNALQTKIEKRLSHGSSLLATYTWSHSLDFNQNQSTQASTNQLLDPYGSLASQYGNSAFNVPNRFVAYSILKYPKSFSGSKSYLLDGWNLDPLVQVQNGLTYSITTNGFPSTASASSGWNGAGGSPTYLPNIGRNTFQFRRAAVFDLRAEKQFLLHEHYNLQLLGEAFNVFNHQNFTGVNSTGTTSDRVPRRSPRTVQQLTPRRSPSRRALAHTAMQTATMPIARARCS